MYKGKNKNSDIKFCGVGDISFHISFITCVIMTVRTFAKRLLHGIK